MLSEYNLSYWPPNGPTHYSDMSNALYHACPGVSKSGLTQILDCPARFYDNYFWPDRERREPSPNMLLGTAVHTLILEPHKWDEEFVIAPDINKRTKAGKEEWAAFQIANKGKEVIDQAFMDKAKAIADACYESPHYKRFFNDGGAAEQSYFWQDKRTGLWCKCRPDWVTSDGVLVDVKTAQDVSDAGFAKACANFHYDMSAAMTLDGVEAVTGERSAAYVFFVVPTTPPFRSHYIRSFVLTDTAQLRGYDLYNRALDQLAFCLEDRDWFGYPEETEVLDLPKWAYFEEK